MTLCQMHQRKMISSKYFCFFFFFGYGYSNPVFPWLMIKKQKQKQKNKQTKKLLTTATLLPLKWFPNTGLASVHVPAIPLHSAYQVSLRKELSYTSKKVCRRTMASLEVCLFFLVRYWSGASSLRLLLNKSHRVP